MFDITENFEKSITTTNDLSSTFQSGCDLCDPSSNRMIGQMSSKSQTGFGFPAADDLLSGFGLDAKANGSCFGAENSLLPIVSDVTNDLRMVSGMLTDDLKEAGGLLMDGEFKQLGGLISEGFKDIKEVISEDIKNIGEWLGQKWQKLDGGSGSAPDEKVFPHAPHPQNKPVAESSHSYNMVSRPVHNVEPKKEQKKDDDDGNFFTDKVLPVIKDVAPLVLSFLA